MFYAFYHNWSIVFCETKSKLFPARIPNYQAVFRKVWILYKFGFVGMWVTGCSFGAVGNAVCRTWESGSFAFPCAVNGVFHSPIACYPHFHGARGAYLTPGFSVLNCNPSFLPAGGSAPCAGYSFLSP